MSLVKLHSVAVVVLQQMPIESSLKNHRQRSQSLQYSNILSLTGNSRLETLDNGRLENNADMDWTEIFFCENEKTDWID